jgi:hypothetical protein
MFPFAVRIEGVEDPPECVEVTREFRFEWPGALNPSGPPMPRDVRLRCGASRTLYVVLPFYPCEVMDYPMTMTVRVAGVGETTVRVLLGPGDGCP